MSIAISFLSPYSLSINFDTAFLSKDPGNCGACSLSVLLSCSCVLLTDACKPQCHYWGVHRTKGSRVVQWPTHCWFWRLHLLQQPSFAPASSTTGSTYAVAKTNL